MVRIENFFQRLGQTLQMWLMPIVVILPAAAQNHGGVGVTASYTIGLNFTLTTKESLSIFPSPAGKSLAKLSLDGNYLIIPVQWEFG